MISWPLDTLVIMLVIILSIYAIPAQNFNKLLAYIKGRGSLIVGPTAYESGFASLSVSELMCEVIISPSVNENIVRQGAHVCKAITRCV